ncbi:MAG TPA: FKBP-type peptidyl-prolyl cis-trans isomerase [Vicinamibacteria bacterium]
MNRVTKRAAALAFAAGAVFAGVGCNKPAPPAASPSPAAATGDLQTDEQKVLYALGIMLGRNVANLNISEAELELVKRGLADGATGKTPAVEMEQFAPKIQQFAQARAAAQAVAEKGKAQAFRDAAAKEPGAVVTNTGLVFTSLKAGTGTSPSASDTVKVHYRGTLTNGTEFDSSYKRGQPIEFPLNGVIPCWTEGVQKMKIGEKAKLVCPSEIAYGDRGSPPAIPGGATLVFEVELLGIVKK